MPRNRVLSLQFGFMNADRLGCMKTGIHPDYVESRVTCTCGNQFVTRSTEAEIHVEICSNCHPFYTGKQKIMDTGGRIDRFKRRQARAAGTKE